MLKENTSRNTLPITHPEIAAQWHPSKNEGLLPSHVTKSSRRKVWWLCDKGHEWTVSVYNRTQGKGCPYCSGRKVSIGIDDLETLHPELASQWHPNRNGTLLPSSVKPHSNKKVWWKCAEGHEWEAQINSRTRGNGCPYCSGHIVIPGKTDLATTHPEIAAQWHPTKNGDLIPQSVGHGSTKKAWWRCAKGHEWEAAISNCTRTGGCPVCAREERARKNKKKTIPVANSLQVRNPELTGQWHPVKNGGLTPTAVLPSSNELVWWLCDKGHEWETKVIYRARGRGCPVCAGRQIVLGYNDLASVNPELAAEWHPTKNGDLTPKEVTAKSNRKVWWRCRRGHEWEAAIFSRAAGSGCRKCNSIEKRTASISKQVYFPNDLQAHDLTEE